MEERRSVELVVLIAAVLGFFAVIALVNAIFYAPAWRAGYRPGNALPDLAAAPPLTSTSHEQIEGRLVVGWKVSNPGRFTLKLDETGGLLLGAPARVWIDRRAVSTVRVMRWWTTTWLLVDSSDHRYGAIVLRPDDLDAAIDRFTELGWPVSWTPP